MSSLTALLLAVFAAPLPTTRALPPPADVVGKTLAVMAPRAERTTCRLEVLGEKLDGDGKPLGDWEKQELEEVRQNGRVTVRLLRKLKNGEDVTAKDPKRGRIEPQKAPMIEPFSNEGAQVYRYEVVGQDTVDRRPAYVVRVTPRDPSRPRVGHGRAWIDTQTFAPLRAEYVPAKLPNRVDAANVSIQYRQYAPGVVLPQLLRLEGKGHFLFIKRGYRMRMDWTRCQVG